MAQRFLELGAPAEEQDENDDPLDMPAAAAAAAAAAQDGSAGAGGAAGQEGASSGPVTQSLGLHRKKQAAQDVPVEERAGLVEACMVME
jgi:hypothetical protein